jgi:serine/threonine protein kinase
MTDRWQKVEKICQSALELEANQRTAFIEQACGADAELRREVGSLLKFDKPGDRFIEQPALEAAARMIAQGQPESLLGQQLGSYQIQSLLGAGGMGVIYKGRDIRLNRPVAMKVLPRDKVSDPERKKRFVQEAKAASALNHPNIITIYDIGNQDGVDFIVMEYVQGNTLDQRIPRKGIKLNQAIKIAIHIADALSRAHAAGIIHRDLKPSNVMLTDDGLVKVLDFGLAKLTEVGGEGREAVTRESLTEEGMIIGTVSYMSPEQAEGKRVDARSDIFSFGAVLYEMLSGQKAFEGDTKMSTLAAIVKQEPKPINQLVSDIPLELEKIINRCLRKDPARRVQHMGDVKLELEDLKEELSSGELADTQPATRPAWRRWIRAGVVLAALAILVGVSLFRSTVRKPAGAPRVVPLTSYRGSEVDPSFSPDGNQVVFSWNGEKEDNFDIYVKLIGAANAVRLTTDPAMDSNPAFSPDGRSIGFVRGWKEHQAFIVIPAIGGPERIIADLPDIGPFDWLPDNNWVVIDGLRLLSTESSEIRSLTSPPDKSFSDSAPAVSPDGRAIAFSRSNNFDDVGIYLLDLPEDLKPKREPRRLTSRRGISFQPAWIPSGQEVIFASEGRSSMAWGLWRVSVSGDKEEPITYAQQDAHDPAVSPKGNRLAYVEGFEGPPDPDIWRLTLSGPGTAAGPPARFIASTRWDSAAQFSPDGKHIAFESQRSGVHGIWVCDADGSNVADLFLQAGFGSGTPHWSPDGQRIAFDSDFEGNFNVYVVR